MGLLLSSKDENIIYGIRMRVVHIVKSKDQYNLPELILYHLNGTFIFMGSDGVHSRCTIKSSLGLLSEGSRLPSGPSIPGKGSMRRKLIIGLWKVSGNPEYLPALKIRLIIKSDPR